MKTIIVMSGSFNPVTKAHYEILSDAVKKYNADEGLFVITSEMYLTQKNLVKSKNPTSFILSESFRMEMINSLTIENPKLSCWGIELGGISPSTYKTLLKIYHEKQKKYPGEEIKLYFLFGADKLKHLSSWYNINELINLCECLVYARIFDIESVIKSDPFLTQYQERIHLMNVENDDLENISSTEVRRRFFASEDYHSLMNDGPYSMMKKLSPKDFPPLTDEDLIKANILYGGMHGKSAARIGVYKANLKVFNAWSLPCLGDKKEHQQAYPYKKEFFVNSIPSQNESPITSCENTDCVDVAYRLINEGYHPAILNLASAISPCGGYHKGTSAQEESLSQASTLSQSLYQFGSLKYKHIRESGTIHVDGVYPLDLNFGGVYSPKVTFFRNNITKYYTLRDVPFDCPVISVASLSNTSENEYTVGEARYFNEDGYLNADGLKIEKNKIRTIYRIALINGHDSIVLGAFGCGVYNLKCDEVASLFKTILEEEEFKNKFKKVSFAIFEGKPTFKNPNKGENGKFKPFYDLFN